MAINLPALRPQSSSSSIVQHVGKRARVLAVDDQAGFLSVMSSLVEATENLEICGEAESAERALELLSELEPDLILMDIWMPGMDGMAAAREIRVRRPGAVIALTSTTRPDELPLAAEELDADAIVWKSDLEPRLLDEIWLRSGNENRL